MLHFIGQILDIYNEIYFVSNYCRLSNSQNLENSITKLYFTSFKVLAKHLRYFQTYAFTRQISFHLDKTFTATRRWLKYGSSQNMVLVRRKSNFHYKHTYFRLFFAHQIILCYFQQPISLARSLINCKCEHLALYARRSTKYVLNYFEGFT